MKEEQMRKKGENNIRFAGKNCGPLNENDDFTGWCRKSNRSTSLTSLKPYNAWLMRVLSISTRINHVANDDEQCSAPVELAQIQNRLFH